MHGASASAGGMREGVGVAWAREVVLGGQEARRRRVLGRQQQQRQAQLARARSVILHEAEHAQEDGPGEEAPAQNGRDDGAARAARRRRARERRRRTEAFYREQMQAPEWMLQVPADLGPAHWLVVAKPEGPRCLVVSARGRTVARKKNGQVMHEFASQLPNGAPGHTRRQDGFCLLECVLHEPDSTFYVLDVLYWKGAALCDTSAECRFFFLQSRLQEIPALARAGVPGNRHRFACAPAHACDPQGLAQAYQADFGFAKDGLLFYNREGRYCHGLTPLVLAWKDAATSRYPVDSPDGVNPYPVQSCVLRVDAENPRLLRAMGGDAIGRVPADAPPLEPGTLARFDVQSPVLVAGLTALTPAQEALLADHGAGVWIERLALREAGVNRNGQADASCRVAYQHAMRSAPLTIATIAARLGNGPSGSLPTAHSLAAAQQHGAQQHDGEDAAMSSQ